MRLRIIGVGDFGEELLGCLKDTSALSFLPPAWKLGLATMSEKGR
jgi:hypothetical protein